MLSVLPFRVDSVLDFMLSLGFPLCESLTYTVCSKAVPHVMLKRHSNLAVLCSS